MNGFDFQEESLPGKESSSSDSVGEKLPAQQMAVETWVKFMEIFRQGVSELKFNTWFKPIKAKSLENNSLLIVVPSQDYYEMIVSRFGDVVSKAIKAILGDGGKIIYEIDTSAGSSSDSSVYNTEPSFFDKPAEQPSQNLPRTVNADEFGYPSSGNESSYSPKCILNSEYTFENFVKGKNNEFATAAAISISSRPGAQYNPMMLYGGVGLGKTHLMQAIGNHVKAENPPMKIMYISGPEFTTSFVQSIRMNRAHEFEKFYKSLDLLIVDDVQFLEGKESTQDSFFQIFNSLYQLKKQIVLSCDKPPHQLEGLEERLITRFQWGLTVDIQAPDLETRIAILNKKCEKEGFPVPYEVLEFIALNIKDNIRSLEGCLKSLIFDAEITRSPINLDMAKRSVLKFGGIKNRKHNIDISAIISAVAKFFNIDESLLRLKTKQQEIVQARHTAMYLSKELTSSSLQTIGAHFGGRNHATVIHACRCIEDSINNDSSFTDKLEQIKEMLLT
ncbi:MAG: chromosomal replication initiator protein DnaA [Chlorobi bacterium]|nr:chromosomal replication initiator protein DnaA [Chlorobiota bacterium]